MLWANRGWERDKKRGGKRETEGWRQRREMERGIYEKEREIKVRSKHLSTHRDLDCKLWLDFKKQKI
jgi:hypothetical protein